MHACVLLGKGSEILNKRPEYLLEREKQIHAMALDFLERLPKKRYTYPEIVIGFPSAVIEKAYVQSHKRRDFHE